MDLIHNEALNIAIIMTHILETYSEPSLLLFIAMIT